MSEQIISKETHPVLEKALLYADCGYSQLPIWLGGGKNPKLKKWAHLQNRVPTKEELINWHTTGDAAIGLICGSISENLIVIDFEYRIVFDKWRTEIEKIELGPLLKTFPWVETGGGGIHVYLRLHRKPPAGIHLAARPTHNPKKSDLLIETRGEGNYVVAVGSPPSVHESGKAYKLINGDLADIPVLEDDLFDFFIKLAKTFDEMPKAQITHQQSQKRTVDLDNHFNQSTEWREILGPHGFKRIRELKGEEYWQKPNSSDNGHHITTNFAGMDLLFCFSTACLPFEVSKPYTKFATFALLNHSGDFNEAAKVLAELGDGQSNNWAEPEELKTDLLPVPPLPEDLIPKALQGWIKDISYRMQVPLSFAATGALIVAGALIGTACGIRPKSKDDWLVIPNLWGGIVANPGKLKSPTLEAITKPLAKLETKAREINDLALVAYQIEQQEYDTRKQVLDKIMKEAITHDEKIK